jgi:hypothetical protein
MAIFDIRHGQNVPIKHTIRDVFDLVFDVTDEDGDAVDLSEKVLVFSIRTKENNTAIATATTAAGEITIGGAGNNRVIFSKDFSSDLSEKSYFYDLDNTTDNKTIIDGMLIASYTGR